uniref:Diphthine--ammonia ligase n=1 Tax=Acrobeloides nanus TaxID=290746 RepID=A0A914D4W5_9BILA
MLCKEAGHEIVCLANLFPSESKEIDSYMYQSVGHEGIKAIGQATGLPLFRKEIRGRPLNTEKTYEVEEKDEVEDLFFLLKTIKSQYPNIEGVSVGAIQSSYQKDRVENVCKRLNLTPLCYLWEKDQIQLFDSMIHAGVDAIVIKVAAMGLTSKHLGMTLKEIRDHLLEMNKKYGSHVCGEGGEYETFVVDSPLYQKRISVDQCEAILHSDNSIAPVAYLKLNSLSLCDKNEIAQ